MSFLIVGDLTNISGIQGAKEFISIPQKQQSRTRASGKKGYCRVKEILKTSKNP
jgi:hypothetical protein